MYRVSLQWRYAYRCTHVLIVTQPNRRWDRRIGRCESIAMLSNTWCEAAWTPWCRKPEPHCRWLGRNGLKPEPFLIDTSDSRKSRTACTHKLDVMQHNISDVRGVWSQLGIRLWCLCPARSAWTSMFQMVYQMKLCLPRETSLVNSPAGNLAPEPHMHAASVGLIGKTCEK